MRLGRAVASSARLCAAALTSEILPRLSLRSNA